jgi:hypothetical protein
LAAFVCLPDFSIIGFENMSSLKTRAGGFLLLLVGAAIAWFFLLRPLQEAQAGVAEVHYQLKAFVIVPACLVFGLGFLFAGDGLKYRNADHKNLTVTGWILFAIVAILTAAGYWWLQQQFSALGYHSGV